MKKATAILTVFFLIATFAFPQQITEKEIQQVLNSNVSDSVKFAQVWLYCKKNHDNTDSNLKYAFVAEKLALSSGSKYLQIGAMESLGDAYWYRSNNLQASEYYFKELDASEALKWKKMIGRSYYNLGWMKCLQRGDFSQRSYLLKGLAMAEQANDTVGILEVYNALATVYKNETKKNPALMDSANFYFRNLIYYTEMRPRYNVGIHINYAAFLLKRGKNKEAKTYLSRCIQESKKRGDSSEYCRGNLVLAGALISEDSLDKGYKILSGIMRLIEKERIPAYLADAHEMTADVLYARKQYREAADHFRLLKLYTDSMWAEQNETGFLEAEQNYEVAKRENNIRELEHENEISKIKNQRNTWVIFGLLFIALLVTIITVNLFKSNNAKREANRELNEKNQQIEEQKKKVEERNLDITNSINYARRIQEAILPPKDLKYKLFPEAFVLFQPKDIVSGDFYWFAEKKNRRLISAIDCTGHGVPGAFMSMIGNTFLNQAINEKELVQPALILDELRKQVITSLKQTDVIDSTKDGMDMALLSFDDEKNQVEFAGANNPLWLIRKGDCIEYSGDKRPIGFYRGKGLPFANHVIPLEKGDTLYIFTDGFADQFGGPQGKKLKYKTFRDILLSIQNLDMMKQEAELLRRFSEWKGDLEQVDDVCVIGIRV